MIVFVPEPNIQKSVACLDMSRLGKQRLEALDIIDALFNQTHMNHQAFKMWEGSRTFLKHYFNACVKEWTRRGYKNTMPLLAVEGLPLPPRWWGDPRVHRSHQVALMSKAPEKYAGLWPELTPRELREFTLFGYFWPSP